ncbi:hypothetical protein [Chlamydia sp.]|uniref:hypothetical protein n=1 Tax=Chlamydia sp. TaxID=35827 RepID=UPI0025C5C2A4|nr:hypothetical protein [Chlamydia sp.]MBQ8498847.1 hypothetical protein [Chlamydia sp.]
MEILYFLAFLLREEEIDRLSSDQSTTVLFDAEKYLMPIRYKQRVYLAKPVKKFPMSVEAWQLQVRHVTSLWQQRFHFFLDRDPLLLACEAKQVIMEGVFDLFISIS